jgi:hypothetical protein
VSVPTRGATITSTKMAELTGAEKAHCVFWFEETRSATQVQRRFRTRYIRNLPSITSIYEWNRNFVRTRCVCVCVCVCVTLDPYFFLTKPSLDFFYLSDDDPNGRSIFQQNGAPPQYLRGVRDCVNQHFPDR